jgi:hypothetical protein
LLRGIDWCGMVAHTLRQIVRVCNFTTNNFLEQSIHRFGWKRQSASDHGEKHDTQSPNVHLQVHTHTTHTPTVTHLLPNRCWDTAYHHDERTNQCNIFVLQDQEIRDAQSFQVTYTQVCLQTDPTQPYIDDDEQLQSN